MRSNRKIIAAIALAIGVLIGGATAWAADSFDDIAGTGPHLANIELI